MSHAIIHRAAWDSSRPTGLAQLDPRAVAGFALHWPGDGTTYEGRSLSWTFSVLRAIETYHREYNGWSDIAYQMAVTQNGDVIELRGMRYVSAANGDYSVNRGWGAVLLMLGTGETPTSAMIEAVAWLRNGPWREMGYGLTVTSHSAIRPAGTLCPGDKVRALIRRGAFNQQEDNDMSLTAAEFIALLKDDLVRIELGNALRMPSVWPKSYEGSTLLRSLGQMVQEIEADGEVSKNAAKTAASASQSGLEVLTALRDSVAHLTMLAEAPQQVELTPGQVATISNAIVAAVVEQIGTQTASATADEVYRRLQD